MNGNITDKIRRAFFISPIVNMERLITDMMSWANVTEEDLQEKKYIETEFGETLSLEYLRYVREHPITWNVRTDILYGDKDNLTAIHTIKEFAEEHNASLIIMEQGEHWFHTEEQMIFLDNWIRTNL